MSPNMESLSWSNSASFPSRTAAARLRLLSAIDVSPWQRGPAQTHPLRAAQSHPGRRVPLRHLSLQPHHPPLRARQSRPARPSRLHPAGVPCPRPGIVLSSISPSATPTSPTCAPPEASAISRPACAAGRRICSVSPSPALSAPTPRPDTSTSSPMSATSPASANSKSSSTTPIAWKPSDASPAASPTTSTTSPSPSASPANWPCSTPLPPAIQSKLYGILQPGHARRRNHPATAGLQPPPASAAPRRQHQRMRAQALSPCSPAPSASMSPSN